MIYIITFLSLVFIGIAFLVNENNAKYLLSGYNTMSEVEREKFDIKNYIPYFRKFHIFLGVSLFIIGIILYFFVSQDWSGIFMGTYPILAYVYFIWKGNKFYKETSKKHNLKTIISMIIIFIVFFGISGMFYYSLQDNFLEVNENSIKIEGDYGIEILKNDIKSIELVNELPEISIKTNGFALEKVKKGHFKTKNGEKVRLLINTINPPFIYITSSNNEKIYYSSKEISNQTIYNRISEGIR